ncbi:hypothetical protein TW84_20970 [Vibrio neptunius]|uniref:hypothetical protein n=1 Tax=Vibrio neptunius TaxID=170651 RepID=UPI0005F9BB30|nr:hypothetical protein [Vibrio neptunius]KJY85902.1 hypothetical protein TW84_20970 [Vibrio neptunius]
MSFIIKDTQLKVFPTTVAQHVAGYIPFPVQDNIIFDQESLLPIGLLSYSRFDDESTDEILIAMPNIQGVFDGDYPFVTYSLTSDGWALDDDYSDALEYNLEEHYSDYYRKSAVFYRENEYLTHDLASGAKAPLFELGGQPPLGENWDAMLYDEMEDNPELDHYHDVMDDESGPDFERMSTREITYFDEELGKEFVFLGTFSFDTYLDGGGEGIVFYQPELKKVMVVAEFS